MRNHEFVVLCGMFAIVGMTAACGTQQDEGEGSEDVTAPVKEPSDPSPDPDDVDTTPLDPEPSEHIVAIAKLRELDPLQPDSPYSLKGELYPLRYVYFDGGDSYDPEFPDDPSRVARYEWTVTLAPLGADPELFQIQGSTSRQFSMWTPITGNYTVQLVAWDSEGQRSVDNYNSQVSFVVAPAGELLVELTWDNETNDQDLHLVWLGGQDRVCDTGNDCHWRNCRGADSLDSTVLWNSGYPAQTGPNPALDIDDTNGLGPENIGVQTPMPGTYRIYVHYYGDYSFGAAAPTKNTIRISLNGQPPIILPRTLNAQDDVWAVADIVWGNDGVGEAIPYPSDSPGELGAVATMTTQCSGGGWAFPHL